MLKTMNLGQQSEKVIQNLLRFADWRPGSEGFLEQLVLHLAESLAVDIVLVGEFVPEGVNAVRSVAVCDSGKILQNIDYTMAAALAEKLVDVDIGYYPTYNEDIFTTDCFLDKNDAESCFAMLLRNASGEKVGFLLAADRKPMPDRQLVELLFHIVASQVTVELERRDKDRKLKESEERYRIISELISDYAYSIRIERDGRMIVEWVTDTFTRMTGYTFLEIAEREGQQRLNIFHPDDKAAVSTDLARLLEGKDVVNEYRILTKSGD